MSHYQEDYQRLVANLLANYPEEEAMARAVGGDFTGIGNMEVELLVRYGLKPDSFLIDVGCGSGRLTQALVRAGWKGHYLGYDVVPALVDYTRQQYREAGSPFTNCLFKVSDGLTITTQDAADLICFFSVFTHLKPEESYVYLEQAHKALRAGGRVIASYLDYALNWDVWEAMVAHTRGRTRQDHLNTFLHAEHLVLWASRIGFRLVDLYRPDAGQCAIVLEK